jgi:Cdc6-like AAA superfamily ATPase
VKDNREEIIENIARLLKYRIRNKQPKRSHKIIVAGSPGSGRSTLSKALCNKY